MVNTELLIYRVLDKLQSIQEVKYLICTALNYKYDRLTAAGHRKRGFVLQVCVARQFLNMYDQ